jgi:hypothetical protein
MGTGLLDGLPTLEREVVYVVAEQRFSSPAYDSIAIRVTAIPSLLDDH